MGQGKHGQYGNIENVTSLMNIQKEIDNLSQLFSISNMENTKNIQKKYQSVLTRTYKKRQILFLRFVAKYTHCCCQSPSFFKGREWKCGKLGKLGRRGDHFFKKSSGQKGNREKNAQLVGVMGCFCFNLLIINYHDSRYFLYIIIIIIIIIITISSSIIIIIIIYQGLF